MFLLFYTFINNINTIIISFDIDITTFKLLKFKLIIIFLSIDDVFNFLIYP